jgi:hypothetical protein
LTATNLSELASAAEGPWFHEFRVRTLLDPTLIDNRPELLQRALQRAGIEGGAGKSRRVKLTQHPPDDLPPIIDWTNVYEAFTRQSEDLFAFLGAVKVDGRQLNEEERVDGYCAILSNEDWAGALDNRPFPMVASQAWEYAVIKPAK